MYKRFFITKLKKEIHIGFISLCTLKDFKDKFISSLLMSC